MLWPTRKERVSEVCLSVAARHGSLHCSCSDPVQLSACKKTTFSPKPWVSKKKCNRLMTLFTPFPHSPASSVRKFTCLGSTSLAIHSEHTTPTGSEEINWTRL